MTPQWISWFLSSKGNEYFCEVEEDYILDRFNLTGLNTEVANYSQALDLITDNLGVCGATPRCFSPLTVFWPTDDEIHDELRGTLDVQARLLYGLIHARWIVTARGLAKMVRLIRFTYKIPLHTNPIIQLEKYKRVDFGRCPRVLCQSQPLLPVGLTDVAYEKSVKLYCGRCEDIYSPKSSRHGSIDGAYFGTSFPHLLFMCYPALIPTKNGPIDGPGFRGGAPESNESSGNGGRRPRRGRDDSTTGDTVGSEATSTAAVALKAERYRPRIFGFQVNEIAKLQRWQEAVRDRSDSSPISKLLITHRDPGKSHDWKIGKRITND